jgi:hypothetical protein
MDVLIEKIIDYLLEEADFNRSWTDGRRQPPPGATQSYMDRRIFIAEERDEWVQAIRDLRDEKDSYQVRMDEILKLDDIETPDGDENIVSAVNDALCYLRDQWNESEAKAEQYREQLDARCEQCAAGEDVSKAALAAARADAVREFAEWLDAHCFVRVAGEEQSIEGLDVLARYLSSLGVPSARPDDAGRVW